MPSYSLSHVADHVLLRDLAALVFKDRTTTASLLAHIAEVDTRRLYAPAACPSMYHYCVGELHLSEGAALKRIRAARTARKFPVLFPAVADGRLHLSAVVLLSPHLTPETVDELVAAATHRSVAEIELLLAERYPRPDVQTRVQVLGPLTSEAGASPAPPEGDAMSPALGPLGGAQTEPLSTWTVETRSKAAPLSPGRYALQFTIEQEAHDDLGYVQALLGHALPSGDVAKVFGRAMKALIRELERDKFAATDRPGRRRGGSGARHVPAAVKRTVWQRDGGQCTFVSEQGKRCPALKCLEFDHLDPVARGGQAGHPAQVGPERMQLRCRAHNQYTAERVYGAGFMERKREEARRGAAVKRAAREAEQARKTRAAAEAREAGKASERAAVAAEQDPDRSVVPWLRALGLSTREALAAAERCEALPDASLEERVKFALSSLVPRGVRRGAPASGGYPVARSPA